MNEITYTKQGDYLIPDLTLPTQPELQLGRYALLHKNYLEQHRQITYLNLLTSGKLDMYLHDVEQLALMRLEQLMKQFAQELDVTEDLKAENPMQWTKLMNNIKNHAEEIIFDDLIYH